MTTGTITLTNKSTAVTGIGTAFTTDLAVGGFIVATVGGTPYTLGIQAIGSDTSLTLTKAYDGPTTSGVAFDYVPLATLNLITSALASQVSYAIRGLNLDKNNWQLVFSESGDITITIPDGTTFTGPSWKKISDLLADIDPDALQQIAVQVAADAQQVATDRADVDTKAAQVSEDAATASSASASAVSANTSAQSAKTDAVEAKVAAEAARDAAQSANPDNQLKKANNLSDVENVATARNNIGAAGAVDLASFIRGLDVTLTASGISVGLGAFALPVGSVQAVTSAITASYPTLTASTWYHLYLYNNSGTVALEVSTTEPVAYAYPAHQKTGDATRRYIGSFHTTSASVAVQEVLQGGQCFYQSDIATTARILAGGVSTALTAMGLAATVPTTAVDVRLSVDNNDTSGVLSIHPRNNQDSYSYALRPSSKTITDYPLQSYPNIYYVYRSTPAGGGAYVDVAGYKYAR